MATAGNHHGGKPGGLRRMLNASSWQAYTIGHPHKVARNRKARGTGREGWPSATLCRAHAPAGPGSGGGDKSGSSFLDSYTLMEISIMSCLSTVSVDLLNVIFMCIMLTSLNSKGVTVRSKWGGHRDSSPESEAPLSSLQHLAFLSSFVWFYSFNVLVLSL